MFTNPSIAKYFFQVIIWNFAFAILVMATTFALGLAVAIVMNSDKLKGKKIYRSILILPYAMPGFAMLLLWRDMFNTDFGLINNLFGLNVDWFGDPWSARAAVLIVQLWMGYPYMFLVCTGALQAIPSDLTEAAGVDGAKPFHAFRTITFPLLLVAVAPAADRDIRLQLQQLHARSTWSAVAVRSRRTTRRSAPPTSSSATPTGSPSAVRARSTACLRPSRS